MTHEISNTDINYSAIMYTIEIFVNNLKLFIIYKIIYYKLLLKIYFPI